MRSLYRFFDKAEHAEAWVTGGQTPVRPASFYRRGERDGIWTPDELVQRSVTGFAGVPDITGLADGFGPGNFSFSSCDFIGDGYIVENVNGNITVDHDDALIVCMSATISRALMARMGKRYAVKIEDHVMLMHSINEQVGRTGGIRPVQYTKLADRNHWLKSYLDMWQTEVRATWLGLTEEKWVTLPPGIGSLVAKADIPERAPIPQLFDFDLQPPNEERFFRPETYHAWADAVAIDASIVPPSRADRRRLASIKRREARRMR